MHRIAAGVAETAKRAFFRSFFRLLLAFIALAEWACVAWILFAVGVRPPPAVHVLATAPMPSSGIKTSSRTSMRSAATILRWS